VCELRRFQNARCNDKNSSYLSVRLSIRMEQLGSHLTDIRDIWYLSIFWKSAEKMQGSLISDNNGYYTWRPLCILIISRSVVVKMRNVPNKSCGENQNTHFIFSNSPPPPESHAVFDMIWKNTVDPDRPRMTIWRMRIACWIPKAANTHS
jgi:hypothetical protein